MKRALTFLMMAAIAATTSTAVLSDSGDSDSDSDSGDSIFRRTHFSNEFNLQTPEGINARGGTTVRSTEGTHEVSIHARGLTPGRQFVIVNHFFEPVAGRGVGPSLPADDPSCTGHFQFIGAVPIVANDHGEIETAVEIDQLAPHIWVVDLAKFVETTAGGTQAPSSPDSFATGGLLIPYDDLLEDEASFVDTQPLTDCN